MNDDQKNDDMEDLDLEAILNEQDDDDTTTPDEVKKLDEGDPQKKASAAYAKLKRERKAIAKQLSAEREAHKVAATPPPQQATPAQSNDRLVSVVSAFRQQACANLGVSSRDQAPELVDMETQRLYNQGMATIERKRQLQTTAGSIIENKLTAFNLAPEISKEVKKRLESVDVLQRTEDNVVRGIVAQVLGEAQLNGSSAQESTDPDGMQQKSAAGSTENQHTGALKNKGSSVPIGQRRLSPKQETPPTPEEKAEMSKLGFHDLAAYRAAKSRTSAYKGVR